MTMEYDILNRPLDRFVLIGVLITNLSQFVGHKEDEMHQYFLFT